VGDLCLADPIGCRVGGVIPNSRATGIVQVAADLNVMPQPAGAVAVDLYCNQVARSRAGTATPSANPPAYEFATRE
jgi:hypothetical protein